MQGSSGGLTGDAGGTGCLKLPGYRKTVQREQTAGGRGHHPSQLPGRQPRGAYHAATFCTRVGTRPDHGCSLTSLKPGDTFSGPRFLLASSVLQHTPDTPFEQVHLAAKRTTRRPSSLARNSRYEAEGGFPPLACCAMRPHSFSLLTRCIPSFISSHLVLPPKEACL